MGKGKGNKGRGGRGKSSGPSRPKGAPKRDLWDDPDSDDEGDADEEDKEERLEREHAKWANDEDADDDEDEDANLKGSDSEASGGEGKDDFLASLQRQAEEAKKKRKAPQQQQEEDEGLWDPLAGRNQRRKRKLVDFAAPGADEGRQFDAPGSKMQVGTIVCLAGLAKAPQLNGKTGTVMGPVDGVTGRCPVLLADGVVKSLKKENLREVLTGAVVRLKDLKAAPELNGRLAECGSLDLTSGRYNVTLADGKSTQKKIKEENVELARRYVTSAQMLSTQRRPFCWKDVLRNTTGSNSEISQQTWAAQVQNLKDLGLPAPRLLPCEALAVLADGSVKDLEAVCDEKLEAAAILADKAPVDNNGQLACRIFLLTYERDSASPSKPPRSRVLQRIGCAAQDLLKLVQEPVFVLLPWLCVRPLPCLHDAAQCAWPLYLDLCQAVLCVDTEHRMAKAWVRLELLLAGLKMSKPVYLYPLAGQAKGRGQTQQRGGGGGGGPGWLLSDTAVTLEIGALADGQVLPAEKPLLERMASEVLDGWRSSGKLTAYEL